MIDTVVDNGQEVVLTRREIEILSLMTEGRTAKDIADQLFVSKRTVDFHLRNAYRKLEVTNRIQAIRRASALGLLETIIPNARPIAA